MNWCMKIYTCLDLLRSLDHSDHDRNEHHHRHHQHHAPERTIAGVVDGIHARRRTLSLVRLNGSVGLVDIAPMINVYDRDRPRLVVNPVDDPVAAAASGVPVVQWRQ